MHGPLRLKTAKKFSINSRQIRSWVKDKKSILQNSRSNAKRYTKEKFLLMEKKLEEELLELGKNGTSLKRWCFTHRRRKILNDLYPETECKFSDHWFGQFSNWKGLSLREKTHKRHKNPAVFRLSIQQYQAKLLPNRNGETTNYVTWLVLTKPLFPFVTGDNKTFDSTGAKEIRCATGSSGLYERQCTAQLTTFADGSILPTLLNFRGENKHIKIEEKPR